MRKAEILRVDRLDCPVVAYDWPFARANAAKVATHWQEKVAQKPALFDGRVLLCQAPQLSEGVYRANYFETAFSAFMAWRDFGFPGDDVYNGFGMAALRSADGAFLLGEMAAHTASAGAIYFPAGTPDLHDIAAGRVDLARSVVRELREETGLDAADAEVAPDWTIVKLNRRIAYMKTIRFDICADELVRRFERWRAGESHPELAALHALRSLDDLARLDCPDFIRAYIAHALQG
ncbi:MAG: NUDIX hydrolase [Hyphomicrobiales bacterium]|nr:NUDIX hydrolase [Hyphomicrobiales bacterium]